MRTINTADAKDAALDWLVAYCEGYKPVWTNGRLRPVFRTGMDVEPTWPHYSTNWNQGGPIIDREISNHEKRGGYVYCNKFVNGHPVWAYGPNLLIAAMRCYVASKLGATVQVPEELL